jgi:hypothetical protein
MFPNVRLLIAATFASVLALSFGFGVFAAFRVNHEPLSRLPPVRAPFQLAADNTATVAAVESFDASSRAGEAPFGASVTALAFAPERHNSIESSGLAAIGSHFPPATEARPGQTPDVAGAPATTASLPAQPSVQETPVRDTAAQEIAPQEIAAEEKSAQPAPVAGARPKAAADTTVLNAPEQTPAQVAHAAEATHDGAQGRASEDQAHAPSPGVVVATAPAVDQARPAGLPVEVIKTPQSAIKLHVKSTARTVARSTVKTRLKTARAAARRHRFAARIWRPRIAPTRVTGQFNVEDTNFPQPGFQTAADGFQPQSQPNRRFARSRARYDAIGGPFIRPGTQ